jgi:multiple antibiotic resistance protein
MQYHTINIIIAILLNMILVYLVLKSSSKIEKMLGSSGLNYPKGLVLLSFVKLFAANVKVCL